MVVELILYRGWKIYKEIDSEGNIIYRINKITFFTTISWARKYIDIQINKWLKIKEPLL